MSAKEQNKQALIEPSLKLKYDRKYAGLNERAEQIVW